MRIQVSSQADQFATVLNWKYTFSWEVSKLAEKDWFMGFMGFIDHHPELSLRSPEVLDSQTNTNKARNVSTDVLMSAVDKAVLLA